MELLKPITELDLKGRRVFVRVDFNVPLKSGPDGRYVVAEANRIEAALPTIQYVLQQGGKCILASHLGRPEGKPNAKYSLEPVASKLSELLKKDVVLTEDSCGDGPRGLSLQMRPQDVMLLENLRFHPGEEENSSEFANRLLGLCDVYISDAFGTLHRAHASTSALPKLVTEKGVGFLVEKELHFLQPLRDNPARPFVLVMGGSKVSDKIGILEHFMDKVDAVLIGGAMSYAFLKAMGMNVGRSLCKEDQVKVAAKIIKSASARKVKILLPTDHVVAKSLENSAVQITSGQEIPSDMMGVDIGPRTLLAYETQMASAETIFWNGPMGVFENPAFAKGTFEMARMISESKAKKLAGGGDSVAAIVQSGREAQFDFISTGGGATLEYLEGKELPGLKALEVYDRSS